MSTTATKSDINDDVFAYEGSGGFTQCISGLGRNAIENIVKHIEDDDAAAEYDSRLPSKKTRDSIEWHIKELVAWCRHFNGELKRAKVAHDEAAKALKMAMQTERDAFDQYRAWHERLKESARAALVLLDGGRNDHE